MDLSLGEMIKLHFIRNKRLHGALCPPRAHRESRWLVTGTTALIGDPIDILLVFDRDPRRPGF